MRLPQVTTRRLMVAVALVSVLFGGIVQLHRLKRWRNHYLQLANEYARKEQSLRSPEVEIMVNGQPWPVDMMVSFLSARKKAYLHAASRPWLSVPPALPSMRIEIRYLHGGKGFSTWATWAGFDHMRRVEADDAWEATYGGQGL